MTFWKPIRCNRHFTLAIEKRTLRLIALLVAFFLIMLLRTSTKHLWERKRNTFRGPPCIVLWWNKIGHDMFYGFFCNYKKCILTSDRSLLPHATAIIFYGTDFEWDDLPLPRNHNQIWALLHEESPRNQPVFMFPDMLKYFNYTSTFSRYSDFPLSSNELSHIALITDQKFTTPLGYKNNLRSTLAPVLFLQSDCFTMTGRTSYVKELMKYIPIDSYGPCLNNRKMPERLQVDHLNNIYSDDVLRFIGQYKFMISMENGVCIDYITEKFWRPLAAGTIPIYFGSPSIRDWEPHNHSAIYISDFKNSKDLANYLHQLDKNDTEYIKYLYHKFNQIEPITNMRLIEEMYVREEGDNVFVKFSCQVLRAIWSNTKPKTKMANTLHYSCPLPIPYPAMEDGIPKEVKDWNELIDRAACVTKAADELLQQNKNFTKKEFDDAVKYKPGYQEIITDPKTGKKDNNCPGCSRRCKRLAFVLCMGTFLALTWIRLNNAWEKVSIEKPEVPLLMLWWTGFKGKIFQREIYVGENVCTITNDRQLLGDAEVILFYGPQIVAHDMPLPRRSAQLWTLIHDVSPQDKEILLYENVMQHFNYTSSFSRHSDFPLTLFSLPDERELIRSTYLRPFGMRSLDPILFMENNCDTMSGRENYVRELMSYTLVHSSGNCLRNTKSPRIKGESDLLHFMAKFKFILAFEDAICEDYITSTYWKALTVGAIPIYFGAPNIRDWEPHNHSAIYISDYENPKDLANYISYLAHNETAFNEYLHHKYDHEKPITNSFLLNTLLRRNIAYYTKKFDALEKDMCQQIGSAKRPQRKIANRTHMDCPLPQPYPSSATTQYRTLHTNQWKTKLAMSKCTAYVLNKSLLKNNHNFNSSLINMLPGFIARGLC